MKFFIAVAMCITVIIAAILHFAPEFVSQPEADPEADMIYTIDYTIFNIEDGTIDDIVTVTSVAPPNVSKGQIAIEGFGHEPYVIDVETVINFNGADQPYKASAYLTDDDFKLFYNTHFASSEKLLPDHFSPQLFIRDEFIDSPLHVELQEALAGVPATTKIPKMPEGQAELVEYWRQGKTAKETQRLLGYQVSDTESYAYDFSRFCATIGVVPVEDELNDTMNAVLGITTTWSQYYMEQVGSVSNVPCAIVNKTTVVTFPYIPTMP